jgi:putative tricarboxylic transport membrane protein
MTDRLSGFTLLVFSVWFGILAWRLPTSFFSDPVGSRLFPLGVAVFLAPLALYLLLRPSPVDSSWPDRATWPSLAVALVTLVAYAWMLEPLGFIMATVISFQLLALVFQAPFWKGLLASVLTTLVLFVLFGQLLELYLPPGRIFRGWFG